MLTGKQRSYLRKLGHDLDPTVYIGKSGITDNIIGEMETGFELRELVKVKLQESCDMDPKEVGNQIALTTNAEFVQAIGRKFILYRRSVENPIIVLPKK